MAETLPPEDAKILLELCRAGRLYDIEKWIAAGKSLTVPADVKKTPLHIAVNMGFHSLVELLARNETNRELKNRALADAVSLRRMDFVQLLLANGAEITEVPFCNVLLTWEPTLIRFFLANGADVVTGAPFAEAFGAKIRTALRPFIEYKQAHPELAHNLQEQTDRALRYFCKEGNLKWVSLMLYAGANPRTPGPELYDRDEDPECYISAMQEACYAENVQVLRKLRPRSEVDNLNELLSCASVVTRTEAIKYLLELGANPNDKPNGGSSALDRSLSHMNIEGFNHYGRLKSRYNVSRSLESVKTLIEHGALWRPEARDLKWIRRILCECEPEVMIELLSYMIPHQSCSPETIWELLHPPQMQQHLSSQTWKLARLKIHLGDPKPGSKPKRKPPPPISHELLSRYNRDKLYEEAWTTPMQRLAHQYGLSDVGLAKVCRKLRIPVPGRGYWAKKQAGRSVGKRPPLPPVDRAAASRS